MGLFEDIWDWIKSKVQGLINSSLTTFKSWVNSAIKSAINAVDWIITNVTKYIDNSITYIDKSLNYWGDQITQYIDNSTHYWGDILNETFIDARQYITNVIGVTQAALDKALADNRGWMQNFFKLMDPGGFLKDPLGFINAAFAIQGEIVNNLAVKSFWMGFEEGLTEEVV